MPQRISDVMTRDPISMTEDATLHDAAVAMRDRDIGDIVVTTADGEIRGIVTDRDIVVRGVAEGSDPASMSIGEACSGDIVTVAPDDAAASAVKLMDEHAIRRLPVADDGSLVGIVSIGDLAMDRDPESVFADISGAAPNN